MARKLEGAAAAWASLAMHGGLALGLAVAFGLRYALAGDAPGPGMMGLGAVWGVALGTHARFAIKAAKAAKAAPEQALPPEAEPVSSNALAAKVQAGLRALEAAWGTERGGRPDFVALGGMVRSLGDRLSELQAGLSRGSALAAQEQEALARLQAAQTEVERESHELELNALRDRLASHQGAQSVVRRLEAELRTLEHRVEALRLDLSKSGSERPLLDGQAREIRDQLQAASEIDEHLAKARRAARAQLARG